MALLRSWHLIPPKDHSHTVKIARIIFPSHPIDRYGALYGTAFPFRAKQSNVFILPVCSFQGTLKGKKKLLLISRKMGVFAPLFSKIFEENFQMKNPLTYKPKKRTL